MQLKEDPDQFDKWQAYFSYEVLRTIKEKLLDAKLSDAQVRELTTKIGFHLSCLLDGSATFMVDGEKLTPVLTFSPGDDLLVHQGSPSSLHEYVHGNADELFEE
jgi:hypothetical protein